MIRAVTVCLPVEREALRADTTHAHHWGDWGNGRDMTHRAQVVPSSSRAMLLTQELRPVCSRGGTRRSDNSEHCNGGPFHGSLHLIKRLYVL
jgi:hypothetical protein